MPEIEESLRNPIDFKSTLQERLARSGRIVGYEVAEEIGPPHDRIFEVVARVADQEVGRGRGRSKKAAEQEAARAALDDLPVVETTSLMHLRSISMKGFKSFPDRTRWSSGPACRSSSAPTARASPT